ncbi:uncharacterized protein LOC124817804 isoform X1 [Hydra vulgaris]|uniref:uncharacterized protein LOC124817804 isoform X1 n=1 Tax=Hydra vulgaris TaxID=6087 RepID=UPI001F5E39BD|nr:cell number regulator 2-like isoform X1 [Hydra vulgaris]
MPEFSNSICGCCGDISICLTTFFLPCLTAGKNAEFVGGNCLLYGCLSLTCVNFITDGMTRGKIREKYGINGSFICDLIYHCFCPCCALIQEAQEIKAHGAPGLLTMARE